ncbi:MAG: carboxypeptidase-like regulatory domain-containing protein, partial [Actinomycetota bacterium]
MSSYARARANVRFGFFVVVLLAVLAATLAGRTDRAGGATAAFYDAPGCTANSLEANDDGSSSLQALPFTMNFLGSTFSSLYVNNNGNVTFSAPLSTYVPFSLTASTPPIIAPMFGDVDTRGAGSSIVTWGTIPDDPSFGGHDVFCVQWKDVGYYSNGADKLNSAQLLLVDRSDQDEGDVDIYFNYDKIEWDVTATSQTIGVGYASGNGETNGFFELPCSLQPSGCLDTHASTGLTNTSTNSVTLGRHIFAIRSGGFVYTGQIIGSVTHADNGAPISGAFVQACGTVCRATLTSGTGEYQLLNLPPGTYTVSVSPPAGLHPASMSATVDEDQVVRNFELDGPTPMPEGSGFGDGEPGTVPSTVVGQPTALRTEACSGATDPRFEIIQDDTVRAQGPLNEGGPGANVGDSVYTGSFTPDFTGPIVVRYLMTCPGGAQVEIEFNAYIDPSGNVYDQFGEPIEGATVTLYRSDSGEGPFSVVPDGSVIMSPSNRTNPDTTDTAGHFAWDVVTGYYYVTASATDCHRPGDAAEPEVRSQTYEIPPPVTDIVLALHCPGRTGPTGDGYTISDASGTEGDPGQKKT